MDKNKVGTTRAQGTQVMTRVSAVLRVVAAPALDGVTTSEAAASTSLARPTGHRLLSALLDEGFVDRDNRTGRRFPGFEAYLTSVQLTQRKTRSCIHVKPRDHAEVVHVRDKRALPGCRAGPRSVDRGEMAVPVDEPVCVAAAVGVEPRTPLLSR